MIGDTHSDGTVVWKEDFLMGIGKLPLVIGYNHKETYTTSGTFVAPMTGLYRITLQGGGGGGGGAGTVNSISCSGGGGGQGGYGVFYETLIAGTTYNFTVGAGGSGGAAGSSSAASGDGSDGGASTITINGNVYLAGGGTHGRGRTTSSSAFFGGNGGTFKINDTAVNSSAPGTAGQKGSNPLPGGSGGGMGGSGFHDIPCYFGGGGSGGAITSVFKPGHDGANGYITFEWFDPADVWPNLFPAA